MKKVPSALLSSLSEELFQQIEFFLVTKEHPSEGIASMRQRGALTALPQLLSLEGVPQNPVWHPEGDVWIHTMMVIDEAARQKTGDPHWDRVLLWAALCHDLGKPLCTVFEDGRWRSPGHDLAGITPTKAMLSVLTQDEMLIDDVCRLVKDHLTPHFFAEKQASQSTVRRLLRRLGRVPIDLLVRLGRADSFGRTTEHAKRREYPSGEWLLEQASLISPQSLSSAPAQIVLGRHLLDIGFVEGVEVGRTLQQLYQAQLAGDFVDVEGGLTWLKQQKK